MTPFIGTSYAEGEKRQALLTAVLQLKEKGAIEAALVPSPGFYSRIFLLPKPSGEWRPIIDLSALNVFIKCPPFKMETAASILRALRRGQWLTSLDLKDAYFHIPIHPSFRHYLRFCHEGVVWQFKALPFGLNTAPLVFTKVTAAVLAYAHAHGISLHVYIDDWLLNPETRELSVAQTQFMVNLCKRLGWVVNEKKSEMIPSQVATYLGITFDTTVGLAYPSAKRMDRWLPLAKVFIARQAQPAQLWRRVLGHLASLEKLVPYGRVRIRPLQHQLAVNWSQSTDSPNRLVPLNQEVLLAIAWWRDKTHLLRGMRTGITPVHAYLYTDSSSLGWGAHLNDQSASGVWPPSLRDVHINELELRAVWLGLQAFQDTILGSNVAIMCDNVTAIAYLRNQGGTLSLTLCQLASQICIWAESRSITLTPRHLPGHLNVVADQLSRKDQVLKTEWSLDPAVVRRVFRQWGSPHVDLFALKRNSKLPMYMSPVFEPEAWKVDSLVQSWVGLYAYAYPPTSLIRQTLNKLVLDKAELILIAPLWPRQEWFPDLLSLSIDFPLELPPTPKLLKQTFTNHFHQRPDTLNLHAWRLSADSIKLGAFRNKCPNGSLFLREVPRLSSMKANGNSLGSGVCLKDLIQTRRLSP